MPPISPQYDPQQMVTVNTHDILQRQQPATLGTWIVAVMLVIGIITWATRVVTHSHHTSVVAPKQVTAPADPRSAAPAR